MTVSREIPKPSPHVHLVHPGNPFAVEPDGIVTVQRNFVAAAPDAFRFDYWGVERPGVRPGVDTRLRFHGVVRASRQRPVVPVSAAFAAGLLRHRRALRSGVLRFDRIESAVPLTGMGAPKILFLHTWNARDNRNPAAESRWRRLAAVYDAVFDRVIRSMDLVYVLRPDMADHLRRTIPPVADRILPFSVPVDLTTFHPLSPAKRAEVRRGLASRERVPEAAPLVLFAGRIEGQKRPLVIPEVIAALGQGHGVEAHAVVVGAGGLDEALREAGDRLAPGRVHLLAPVEQDELRRLMGAADAFLLPSAFEGLPNVVLESLACGTPVVAARGPGRIAEVVSGPETGALTRPDPRALAEGLASVLGREPDRVACRRAVEPFGPSAVNAPIYREIERLAGRSGSSVSPNPSR